MKKIIFILLFAAAGFAACKKEFTATEKAAIDATANALTNAPFPCTGNIWYAEAYLDTVNGLYSGDYYATPVVYNDKVYVFDCFHDKLRSFDGTNWVTKNSHIPFSIRPNFTFTIGNKAYLGYNGKKNFDYPAPKFLWEYDFVTKGWAEKTAFPGTTRSGAGYFTIGNKGYVVGGVRNEPSPYTALKETWEYDAAINAWQQKADLPTTRQWATGFSIGNKGYVVTGRRRLPSNYSYTYLQSLQEYDPLTNTWNGKAAFPGVARAYPSVFVISGIAYAGGGYYTEPNSGNNNLHYYRKDDFYKYNPVTNAWSQVADFVSRPIGTSKLEGFSINSRGYVIYIRHLPYSPDPLMVNKYTPLSCNPGSSQ